MSDWIKKFDDVISLNGRELLDHYGTISHKLAVEKASLEYEKYKENKKEIEKNREFERTGRGYKEIEIRKVSLAYIPIFVAVKKR